MTALETERKYRTKTTSGEKLGGDSTAKPTLSPLMVSGHSHSIVLGQGNVLIQRFKFFLRTATDRLPDPSEICALDFKREIRRLEFPPVSATIGNDRSIFDVPLTGLLG
jgi:hypothetical protein